MLSCDKEVNHGNITQAVVFEYEFINHAWIYTHFGWLIDENGEVKGYQRTDGWKDVDENGFISKEDVIANLNLTDTVYFIVNRDKMLDYFEDRYDLLTGQIDTTGPYMADAGMGSLFIYVWDVNEEKYQKQLLAARGDINLTNNHPKAKSIIDWLTEIGDQTDRFFWRF